MKTNLFPSVRSSASTLLTTLIISAIISVSLAGYMATVQQQNFLSARSQAWNIAIAIVEAGIEEGLQHLNNNGVNLNCDGWTANGLTYTRSRTLPDGNGYDVRIDTSVDPRHPVITARAYVLTPRMAQVHPGSLFAVIGVSPGDPTVVSRAVRVGTAKGNLF